MYVTNLVLNTLWSNVTPAHGPALESYNSNAIRILFRIHEAALLLEATLAIVTWKRGGNVKAI